MCTRWRSESSSVLASVIGFGHRSATLFISKSWLIRRQTAAESQGPTAQGSHCSGESDRRRRVRHLVPPRSRRVLARSAGGQPWSEQGGIHSSMEALVFDGIGRRPNIAT